MAADPNPYRSAGWTADRARRRIVELQENPTDREAWLDKMHPLHAKAIEHRQMLYQVIAGEPAPPGSTPGAALGTRGNSALPEARILDGRNNPAYGDKHHPLHAEAVKAVSAAYADLYPERGE